MTKIPYLFSESPDQEDSTEQRHGSWAEICALFRSPLVHDITQADYEALKLRGPDGKRNSANVRRANHLKMAAGLFVGALSSTGSRKKNDITHRTLLTLDFDEDCEGVWEDFLMLGGIPGLDGLAYLVHTTRSHSPDKPRFRVIIPLLEPIAREAYQPVVRAIARRIDSRMLAVSVESLRESQGMFLPTISADQEYVFEVVAGEPLDAEPILEAFPVDDESVWPRRPDETGGLRKHDRVIASPEDKKHVAPIITAFHRIYDAEAAIEEFLLDVYEPAGSRYTRIGSSNAASVRIYDTHKIHSDHGLDRAYGQHLAFDVVRMHRFGDLDDDHDLAVIPMAQWPSFKAMTEFALSLPEVAEAFEDVQLEIEQENLSRAMSLLPDLDDDEDTCDEDDLIGPAPGAKTKPKTAEELLQQLRLRLGKAKHLDGLEALLESIRRIPASVLKDSHRSRLSKDVQDAYERFGEKVTKAVASRAVAFEHLGYLEREKNQSAPDWLRGWCHVYGDSSFYHADSGRLVTKDGFDNLFLAEMTKRVDIHEKTGLPVITASAASLTVWNVPKVYQVRFNPNEGEFFGEGEVQYVNAYRKAVIPDDGYRGRRGVDLLHRLVKNLYPEHWHLVLDYLAHCYRFPGKKLKYALLLKGAEEEGKTLLYTLMCRVLGISNCMVVGTQQLKKEFNDFFESKLLCCVEELKLHGVEAQDVLNQLKAPISNDLVSVEGKRSKVRQIENFCNWLLFTNFEDAVPIEDTDSRLLIIFSRFRTNEESKGWKDELIAQDGADFREELYQEVQDHPWQFIRFFEDYKFSQDYQPSRRAPYTVFKRIMAEDGRSEERNVLEELLGSAENPLITPVYVHTNELRSAFNVRGIGSSFKGRGVSALMKAAGFLRVRRTRLLVDGEPWLVDGWTRERGMCDPDGKAHSKLLDMIRQAKTDFSDFEDLTNVIPIRGTKR